MWSLSIYPFIYLSLFFFIIATQPFYFTISLLKPHGIDQSNHFLSWFMVSDFLFHMYKHGPYLSAHNAILELWLGTMVSTPSMSSKLTSDINLCSEQCFVLFLLCKNGKYISSPKPHNTAFNFWDRHPNPELVDFTPSPRWCSKHSHWSLWRLQASLSKVSLPTNHFGFLFCV